MNEFEKQPVYPNRRHIVQPSYDFSAQFRDDSPQLPEKLPLKVLNISRHPLQKASHPYSTSHLKENLPEPSQFSQYRDGSHVLVKDNFQYDDNHIQDRQRSEKSYTDFNRSLANLGRVGESISSLEEVSLRKNRPKTIISDLGAGFPTSQLNSLSNTTNKIQNSLSYKDLQNASQLSTLKENLYYQGEQMNTFDSHRKSIQRREPTQRHGRALHTLHDNSQQRDRRSLLTEGDSPLRKENSLNRKDLGKFVSQKGEIKKYEAGKKQGLESYRKPVKQSSSMLRSHRNLASHEAELKKRNLGYETSFSNFNHSFKTRSTNYHNRPVTKESLFSKQKRASQESTRVTSRGLGSHQSQKNLKNQEFLDQYTLSEDVQYGNGGKGYSTGLEAVNENKRVSSGEKRNKSEVGRVVERKGHSTVRGSKVITMEKDASVAWKKEIMEIKQDIERRKKSYDRVNKFLKMCDNEEALSEKHEHSRHHHSQQQTQPTLQSLPTQFERSNSPVFSTAANLFGFSKGPEKRAVRKSREIDMERQQNRWNQASMRNLAEMKMVDINVDDEHRTVSRDEENLLKAKEVPYYQGYPRQVCEVTAGSFVNSSNGCSKCFRSPCCCCGTNSNCQIF